MEDRHNQPKITPERIKLQERTEKEEEDRISELPDCLLLEILSRLPSTKEAIKTGALSKKWEHVWTSLSTIIFKKSLYKFRSKSDFVLCMDKTLAQHRQLKLKKFEMWSNCYYGIETQVNNWIRYALTCNVEDLLLAIWNDEYDEFLVDQSLFTNTCLTHLKLLSCRLNPIGAISWKKLKTLRISFVSLDKDLVENISSGSPVLESLLLDNCHVYYGLNITSKSIKNLELDSCHCFRRVDFDFEVKAPNILSLTIKGVSSRSKVLLVNMSSLVEANFDYRNISSNDAEAEEDLKRFIMNLRHIKELKIGVLCSKVLSLLEAKGFVLPSNVKFPAAF